MKNGHFIWFALTVIVLIVPQTAYGQKQKLGIVNYTPPAGWNKTQTQPNVVGFITVNQTTGASCIITLHGATPGKGNPQSDFAKEWNSLVVQTMKAEANPSTETETEAGWTAVGGGGPVDLQGTKAFAFLTVISGFGNVVSVLGVITDQACVAQLHAFITGIDLDKPTAPASNAATVSPPTLDSDGNLVIPQPTRQPRSQILPVSGEIIPDASPRLMSTAPLAHTPALIRFTSRASGRSTRTGDTPMISSRLETVRS